MFRNAFLVYAQSNLKDFRLYDNDCDPIVNTAGGHVLDETKLITAARSYFQEDAALWARPYIEELADGRAVCGGSWTNFVKQFRLKFEVLNTKTKAKIKLSEMHQGEKQSFAAFITEFETWAPRTGYSFPDLFDRLKERLNKNYLERLSYFPAPVTTYGELKARCLDIDKNLMELSNNLKLSQSAGSSRTAPTSRTTAQGQSSGFRAPHDPDAMDISASVDFAKARGLKDSGEVRREWQKAMRGHCSVCGASGHNKDKHGTQTITCKWCGRNGHWERVCLSKLQGQQKAQNVSATPEIEVRAESSSPAARVAASSSAAPKKERNLEAEFAAMRDLIDLQQKQMAAQQKQIADFQSKISQSF